ncbi:MAG: hypothetical protein KBD00_02400 [Candidatus Peribacteraceae bacterium]|nr:hypothetical protein [Candidatus Peribacteraceae bacterium]
MQNSLTTSKDTRTTYLRRIVITILAGIGIVPRAHGASFGEGGDFSILGGLSYVANRLGGAGIITNRGLREMILSVLAVVLDYVTLFAMITVISAGLYLIFSNGDEGSKDKAKKIIIYTVIGLVVIVLSRVIVVFANSLLS